MAAFCFDHHFAPFGPRKSPAFIGGAFSFKRKMHIIVTLQIKNYNIVGFQYYRLIMTNDYNFLLHKAL